MLFKQKLKFYLFCGFGIVILGFFSTVLSQGINPDSLRLSCLPKEVETYAVVADSSWQEDRFILVEYFPNPQEPTWPKSLLIKNPEHECQWVMTNQEIILYSKAKFVPHRVAQDLMLKKYRDLLQKKGREYLELMFSDHTPYFPDGIIEIFPEEKWALDQLKIPVGETFRIVEEIPFSESSDPLDYFE